MIKLKSFFRTLFSNVWFGIQTSYRASKVYFALKLLVLLCETAIPLAEIRLWREVLNGIPRRDTKTVFLCLVAYLFFCFVRNMLERFNTDYIETRYSDEMTFYIEKIMMEKVSRTDLSFFDSASMGDKVRHVRSHFGTLQSMSWLVFDILASAINVIVVLVVVAAYRWYLGLLILLLLVPHLLYNKKRTERKLAMEKQQLRDKRKEEYFRGALLDSGVQFEIKLHAIGKYFTEHCKALWNKLFRINLAEEIRHMIFNTCIGILGIAGEMTVLACSVCEVLGGAIGIGDLQYNIGMASRLHLQTQSLMDTVNRFLTESTRLTELREFICIGSETEKSGTESPPENPEIAFHRVSFRYPNTAYDVLKDCSFTIRPHEKIGLIGLNGAGKSTIIKLLFRFYDPTEGTITLNGTDLREFDIYAVRKRFGVLFQEYVTYCLPLREIIALSDFGERFNDVKLKQACDVSGVSVFIKNWENGFDSVLGRYYADNGKTFRAGNGSSSDWRALISRTAKQ